MFWCKKNHRHGVALYWWTQKTWEAKLMKSLSIGRWHSCSTFYGDGHCKILLASPIQFVFRTPQKRNSMLASQYMYLWRNGNYDQDSTAPLIRLWGQSPQRIGRDFCSDACLTSANIFDTLSVCLALNRIKLLSHKQIVTITPAASNFRFKQTPKNQTMEEIYRLSRERRASAML